MIFTRGQCLTCTGNSSPKTPDRRHSDAVTTTDRKTHTKRDVAAASYMYYCAEAMEMITFTPAFTGYIVSVLLATVLYKCLTARGYCEVFEIQGCFDK
jgi:hypothetical protein